ncbi:MULTISPECIES: cation:proton antiporter [Prevotella]|uniref:Sodium:proton antiporter n=1 Tax=Prevotella herbatica TaxID=2801997 RepID=A0ABN6EKJ2_9BACT|nr:MULTISPECIES: cation:proton antiporter [Prevotella]MDN5554468.1 cation:proton antiporter [Prevotella sp.]BCS84628.1 sodium:proton antiporter [Prevotella herbatica]
MAEIPNLINDLALILIVAGIVTLVFKRLKQPIVLGYIVAGFLVSPHMSYTMSVIDKASIHTWADIGVMFLLFSLGLDFSFKKILKMGMAPIIASTIIIFSMATLGMLAGYVFNWSRMDCMFLGGMLAMSSTTIIYKAFDDLGLRQQRFASLVMSVLIIEDIVAIIMMVMLSALAGGNNPDGGVMIGSIVKIAFFLVLWFVVGIFLIPLFFRHTRRLMTNETMLIVALGLCCLMAVLSTKVGFSSAFGAFVMGSIIAETVEADKIIKLVEPVKNLFGAVFFVSVGMLVDPKVLVEYAVPIVVLVMVILFGQSIFGTFGFMLSGQPMKTAMRCGFSMAQIGEFAFIIASLGLSLGVIGRFLYPVVVAVSVITTFITPYMIRASEPCYFYLENHLPKKWVRRMKHLGKAHINTEEEITDWRKLLRKMLINTVIYGILSTAVIILMFSFVLPLFRHLFGHWIGNAVCGAITVLIISPFLRSMVMKNLRSNEFKNLWTESRLNRLPLIFTVVVKVLVALGFIFYICNYLTRFKDALMVCIALFMLALMVLSRNLKHESIKLERLFIKNLRSREIAACVTGKKRPLFEGHLLERDIHISEFGVPEDSTWIGRSLKDLKFRNRFGVHVSSILRGSLRINIPSGSDIIFPGDRIFVIGDDEQLNDFRLAINHELIPEDPDIEKREMKLRKVIISAKSSFIGKTLKESGIRDKYNCMVIGVDEGEQNLSLIDPVRKFERGDVIWIVGEEDSLKELHKLT